MKIITLSWDHLNVHFQLKKCLLKYKIEISKLKNGYFEAKLIDTESNNPVEFRMCDSDEYV